MKNNFNSEKIKSEVLTFDYFINKIPQFINKENYEKFHNEKYLEKLLFYNNILDIEPKTKSEFINYLIFLLQCKNEYYISSGKILLYLNPKQKINDEQYFNINDYINNLDKNNINIYDINHLYNYSKNLLKNLQIEKNINIILLGKENSGKTYNAFKLLEFFIKLSTDSNKWEIFEENLKILKILSNSENLFSNSNSALFKYKLNFDKNLRLKILNFETDLIDLTLPFSENGRSYSLLHGFILTQNKKFNFDNFDFNFFKKYYSKYNENEIKKFNEIHIKNWIFFENFCEKNINKKEYENILKLFYVIILLNEITILKNNIQKNKKNNNNNYFIKKSKITNLISNILEIDVELFLNIFNSNKNNDNNNINNNNNNLNNYNTMLNLKQILITLMKFFYLIIFNFFKEKIKNNIFSLFSSSDNYNNSNIDDIEYSINIYDFPGQNKSSTLGSFIKNFFFESLLLFSFSHYTSMLTLLENNNIYLKKFQSPKSYDILKLIVNFLKILKQKTIFENNDEIRKLIIKNDNIPSLIQFINDTNVIKIFYSNEITNFSYNDLQLEILTLNLKNKIKNFFKKIPILNINLDEIEKNFINFDLQKFLIKKIEIYFNSNNNNNYLIYCFDETEIFSEDFLKNDSNIITTTNFWNWFGFHEFITYNDFYNLFKENIEIIKKLYNNFNFDKKNKNLFAKKIFNLFKLENDVIFGENIFIIKEGNIELIKNIFQQLIEEKNETILNNSKNILDKNINNYINENGNFSIEIEKIMKLPINNKLKKELIKEHISRKTFINSDNLLNKNLTYNNDNNNNNNNDSEIKYSIENFLIFIKNYSPNFINFNENFFDIKNIFINKEERNKNNIILAKNFKNFKNLEIFFDTNNKINLPYDINIFIPFIIFIQKIFKGYFIRKKFYKIYKFVRYEIILLQKNIRGFLARKKFIKFIFSLKKIITIQIFYKERFKLLNNMANKIQKAYRSFREKYYGISYFKKYFEENKNNNYENLNDFLNETNKDKIINCILYNKNFQNEDKYYNNNKNFKKKDKIFMKLEDRLIQYGQNLKIKNLKNLNDKINNENKKFTFKPKTSCENFIFENDFFERNQIFLKNKQNHLNVMKIQNNKNLLKNCTFKPKINQTNLKRNLDDLFKWQDKVNYNKMYMKKMFEEYNNEKIKNIINYQPEYNYIKNKEYLERNKNNYANYMNNNNIYLRNRNNKFITNSTSGDIWPENLEKNYI